IRVYRWYILQLVVLSALQDCMMHREWTVFWHISGTAIIVIPWLMLDISRDRMRTELEQTYPNVIHLMNEKQTFLLYTLDMHRFWLPRVTEDKTQAFVPLLFKGIPDSTMIISAFCFRDVRSSTLGRTMLSIASVHAIITSLLAILLHKPFRDRV
ncbi:hypothetical protein PENTCL1PPCAC_21656, partial [Pristionchus entomophagus]